MQYLSLPTFLLGSLTLLGPVRAEIIDNSVITDFVDQTPGFFVARPLGVTISGDSAVYLVGTMNFDTEALGSSFIEANMGDSTLERGYVAGFGNGFNSTAIVIADNGTAATAPNDTFAEGVPTKLVIKFDQTTGDITLWVNPDLGTTEALNTVDASVNRPIVKGSTFDGVVFRGGDYDGTPSVVDFMDFAVYYNGNTPFGTTLEITPKLVGFTYDPATGASQVSIESGANTSYILVRANDLDFENPDQSPVGLIGATVGTLDGNTVTTDGDGSATVQFNLGTAEPTTFIRAQTAPPPPPLLREDFDAGAVVPVGWIPAANGAGTAWQVNDPSTGPAEGPDAAASGANCAGTNITANYTPSADVTLTSPAILVPPGGASLSFQQYIDTDTTGDVGTVRLLDADNADAEIIDGDFPVTPIKGVVAGWTSESFTFPAAAAGKNVKVQFQFVSDADAEVYTGFYIDDVVVGSN